MILASENRANGEHSTGVMDLPLIEHSDAIRISRGGNRADGERPTGENDCITKIH